MRDFARGPLDMLGTGRLDKLGTGQAGVRFEPQE